MKLEVTYCVKVTLNPTKEQLAEAATIYLKDENGCDYIDELVRATLPKGFTLESVDEWSVIEDKSEAKPAYAGRPKKTLPIAA